MKKKYTYNKKQAIWFTNNGATLLDADIHKKTNKMFFVFEDNERIQFLYDIWNNRKH